MMHRHSRSRSRGVAAREMEVRQPVEDGRSSSHHHTSHQQSAAGGAGGWPSAPMNTVGTPHQQHHHSSGSSAVQQHGGMTTPPPPPAHMPVTPHSCPPSSYTPHHDPHTHQGNTTHSTSSSSSAYTNFPKTRCYRLNLERPFDISLQKSPLGRDYSGPPVHECDLPPAQGPVEYIPPVHLCSKEELARRRCHSWGGGLSTTTGVTTTGHGGEATTVATSYTGGPNSTIPSELLDNLHVSLSEESTSPSDPTNIAISTARIFRGIVVDRHGVITSMNPRAMRSARGKDGKGGAAGAGSGGGTTTKLGEKSRQAAKIDKAKDLIDDFVENGPGGGGGGNAMSDEENDPTKIVSLFVMGEYEDLNDLVRDGSKKLRESKTLPDEEMLRYNRPRQFLNLHGSGHVSSVGGTHGTNNMIPFSPNSTHFNHANTLSPYGGDATMSGTSSNGTGGTGSDGRVRKRVFSAEKGRAIYHKVLGSTPKIKSNPRDTRTSSSSNGNGGGSSSNGRGRNSSSTNNAAGGAYHPHAYGCLGGSPLAASDANKNKTSLSQQQQSSSNQQGQQQQQQQSTYSPNYFPTQCNFFPNNNDWTEVLGFSVNSLWNCGANGDLTPTMSPHSNPSSPTHNGAGSPTNQFSSQQQQSQSQHGGGHGQAGGGYSNGPPQSQYPQGPPAGYHIHQGYNSSAANGGTGGYAGSSAYNNATPSQYNSRQSNDEGRNPSYGYGRGGSSACVRDTVVM